MKKYGILFLSILLSLLFLGNIKVYANDIFYKDVKSTRWSYRSIMNLTRIKILEGYPDKTFKPEQSISRYEFITLLSRAIAKKETKELDNINTIKLPYIDLKKEEYYYKPMQIIHNYLVKKGFTLEYIFSEKEFKGNIPIRREEVAALLSFFIEDNTTEYPFIDIDNSLYINDIYRVANAGLIIGYNDKTFRPNNFISREECAVIIDRFLNMKQ